jgi:mono/diheme cytochrome c family protein
VSVRHLTLFALFVLLSGVLVNATPPYRQDLIPAQGPTYSPSEDYLKQIVANTASIDKRLERIEAKLGTSGQQQSGALGVIAARCLSCHQDGKAQEKGDGFVLVEKDGALAELSLAEKRRIVRQVTQGKMPPNGKLPDAEVKLLEEYFAPKEEQKK